MHFKCGQFIAPKTFGCIPRMWQYFPYFWCVSRTNVQTFVTGPVSGVKQIIVRDVSTHSVSFRVTKCDVKVIIA